MIEADYLYLLQKPIMLDLLQDGQTVHSMIFYPIHLFGAFFLINL